MIQCNQGRNIIAVMMNEAKNNTINGINALLIDDLLLISRLRMNVISSPMLSDTVDEEVDEEG